MQGATDQETIRLPDPVPRHKPAFALTPLADVMFQLLIFFMLSTSLAPYALLPLGAPAAEAGRDDTASAAPAPPTEFERPQIWHLGRNSLRVGNRRATPVEAPDLEHPKRPIEGLACGRSEVSGRRLWGLIARRFGTLQAFAERHIVMNYCPLVFMEQSGRNRTPDKLPATERTPLEIACDRHLARIVEILEPTWLIGVGAFAEARARRVVERHGAGSGEPPRVGRVLHPSPASPAANRGWAEQAVAQLESLDVW